MMGKYRVVARYDDHIIVVDDDSHFRDFSSRKRIDI